MRFGIRAFLSFTLLTSVALAANPVDFGNAELQAHHAQDGGHARIAEEVGHERRAGGVQRDQQPAECDIRPERRAGGSFEVVAARPHASRVIYDGHLDLS